MNPRYQLVIRALPGNWQRNAEGRLKAFLKAMKRAYGFECVSIAPIKEQETHEKEKQEIQKEKIQEAPKEHDAASRSMVVKQCFMCRKLEPEPEWIPLGNPSGEERYACSSHCHFHYLAGSDIT